MRWLFHVYDGPELGSHHYAAASLAQEGFIHASFKEAVADSARLYFPSTDSLRVLQIDPRRLDVPVAFADTPRGPMPHIHGRVPRDAVRATLSLEEVVSAPDAVTGTRFVLVAFEGMTLLDLVAVYDPLSRIASMNIDGTSSCEIVAGHEGRIWSMDGADVVPRRVRPDLANFDVLVLPGGLGTRTLVNDGSFVAWLKTFPENRLHASVCTGALLLGATGRLDGKRATTHASAIRELARYGATATAERVVDEGPIVTAGGVTSGLDLGLHLVRRLYGDDATTRIARQMEWTPPPLAR